MTRINLVPVQELSDSHLLAEAREIKRIPNCILKGKFSINKITEHYKMGRGHVSFFYNKISWLSYRYLQLYKECINRGFVVKNYFPTFEKLIHNKDFFHLINNWIPTEQDIRVSRTRIAEKIFQKDICQQQAFYRWTKRGNEVTQ